MKTLLAILLTLPLAAAPVTVRWDANPEPDVSRYEIVLDGAVLGSVDAPVTSWVLPAVIGYGAPLRVVAVFYQDGEWPARFWWAEIEREN